MSVHSLALLFRKNSWVPAALCIGLTALLFQNCSKVGFGQAGDTLDSSSVNGDSQTVYVDFKTPKDFVATFSASSTSGLQLAMVDGSTKLTLPSGSILQITDVANFKLTYTPAAGFRSTESSIVLLKDKYGHQTGDTITFIVASTIREIQPAMATRTSGCITCHASINSSYITDFGAGDPYFFGEAQQWVFDNGPIGFYSDRWGDLSWLGSTFSGGVIIPNVKLGINMTTQAAHYQGSIDATILNQVSQLGTTGTLGDYIRLMESHKSVPATVTEKTNIYIGAPSAALLLSRTGLGSQSQQFLKNSPSSPTLAGLTKMTAADGSTYYQSSSLTCDGDLVVAAPVYLKNLVLTTDQGCRIYSTKTIFVNGPITYAGTASTSLPNLQLVSSEWINMGVGLTHCEAKTNPGGWYQVSNVASPAEMRLLTETVPTRAYPTVALATAYNQTLVDEEKQIAGFVDASCDVSGQVRAISYEHIFMNAPRIDSRYTGSVHGVTISEVALFGLSTFAYAYDPVFTNVPVVPYLHAEDYLTVQ